MNKFEKDVTKNLQNSLDRIYKLKNFVNESLENLKTKHDAYSVGMKNALKMVKYFMTGELDEYEKPYIYHSDEMKEIEMEEYK